VNTISNEVVDGRRRRRDHSAEFKAQVVVACRQPGVSIAAVAMANGVNANLARRWVVDAERRASGGGKLLVGASGGVAPAPPAPTFVPLQLPCAEPPPSADIRIELHRGTIAITVSWPAAAAAQCAVWMRELLR
jgi:transposase-like protein